MEGLTRPKDGGRGRKEESKRIRKRRNIFGVKRGKGKGENDEEVEKMERRKERRKVKIEKKCKTNEGRKNSQEKGGREKEEKMKVMVKK